MQSLIQDVLGSKGYSIHVIERDETAFEAVRRMNDHRIGSLVVVDDSHPIGMFTERDVLTRVVAAGYDSATTAVCAVMTPNIIALRRTDTVEFAMRLMTETRCRHLPVIDDGCLNGLISAGDLTKWLLREQRVEIEYLTDYIFTVR